MEYGFLFLGMACGIIIGLQYYKYQITKKRNPKVIEEVKKWIKESER